MSAIGMTSGDSASALAADVAGNSTGATLLAPPGAMPDVSVVIPVKNSQRTIRPVIDALLAQDYPALSEVIVVGDVGDQTWQALENLTDPRLMIIEHEEIPGKREPAIKRDVGLQKAKGQVLALADSDIIMDPDWLSRSVDLLADHGGGVVCGGMRAVEASFWSRFVDDNVVAAKTPRVTRSYDVTAANFGKRGHKPPITANAVMDRSVYDDCSMDDNWGFGYEDYEWFWRVATAGHLIFYAAGLTGAHHHRRRFRDLIREYKYSANGCVHFVRAYPDCPLARKRRLQAVLLPLAGVAVVLGAAAAVVTGQWVVPLAAVPVLAAGVAAREVIRARRLEGVGYAVAGVALGVVFVFTLSWRLARSSRFVRTWYHSRFS